MGDFDDETMVRIYARENATQRNSQVTAIDGSVLAATRLIVKQLLNNASTSHEIVRRGIFESDKAFDTAKGQLQTDKGIGQNLVSRILRDMPGMTLHSIGDSLKRLKSSGAYARNIQAIAGESDSDAAVKAVNAVSQSDYDMLCCMIDENLTQQHVEPKTVFEIVSAAIQEAEKMLRETNNVYDFMAYFKRSRGLPTLLQKSNCPDRDNAFRWEQEHYDRAKLAIEPSGEGLGRGFIQHFLPKGAVPRNGTLQAAITGIYEERWREEGDKLLDESQRWLKQAKETNDKDLREESLELEKQARVLLGKVKEGGIRRALLCSLSNNEKASDPEVAGKKGRT